MAEEADIFKDLSLSVQPYPSLSVNTSSVCTGIIDVCVYTNAPIAYP